MDNLAETSDLLDKTKEALTTEFPENADGDHLIQQWIDILDKGENTRALADKLTKLREAIVSSSPDTATIQSLMNDVAEATQNFSGQVGPEGEMPSELQAIATAMREASDSLAPKS